MQEIKCPNCGEVFVVDESGYAQIVQQVRDKEFEKEIKRREKEFEEKSESALKLARVEQQAEFDKSLSLKKKEIDEKDKAIEKLQNQISEKEIEKKLAVSAAVNEKEIELKKKLEEITVLKEKISAIDTKNTRLVEQLKGQIAGNETEKKLAISEAVHEKEKTIMELQNQLLNKETENKLNEQALKKRYEDSLKLKDEQIEYYKDFKARQSTKMIGESLEQHCLNQFNALRMTAFPTAYFEKDNDARTGSKGDFIFRESQDGIEFISIMFEMKNEMDETATKHKNEDFFK